MKFTFDWLKDHLKTDLSYTEIAEKLTNLGIEVEGIEDNRKKFENFVVGFIESAEKHPNADKLQVCTVNIGNKKLQIVCGAKNARPGIYVAVALVGAFVPAFGEKLKKGVIRGIESFGMMCSTDELLLEDDGIDGIMELPDTSQPGQDLATALGMDDVVFDVSLTPNRADCFSVRGIARDLAAAGAGELLDLNFTHAAVSIENTVHVDVLTKNCDYFSTLAINGVSGQTPNYIAKRLKAIGQGLIHLPVDVANYICIDIGQPLHMFDLEKLSQNLTVRVSRQGELLDLLNGKQVVLPADAIVVTSGDEVLSLAGIMGGEKSGISENSKNILIEGACFDKVAIATAGQKLRLTSDSRTRFERGIDPENVDVAVRYAASIISECCGCRVSNVNKYGSLPNNKKTIELTFSKFNALTGLSFEDFMSSQEGLQRLGLTIRSIDQGKMVLETPSWRHDLEIEEDIIEEILRLQGYENIKEAELPPHEPKVQYYVSDKISDALAFNGYYEVKTFSFCDRKTAEMFADPVSLIDLMDASVDFTALRPTIVVSHLKAIKSSQNKSQRNSKIFEIGRCFKKQGDAAVEQNVLVATMSEKNHNRNWRHPQSDVSVFDAKSDLDRILNLLGISFRLQSSAPSYYHPGRSGTYVFQKDTVVAHFGEIHPMILSDLGVDGPIICFELFLDNIPELFEYRARKPLVMSHYQTTTRDFSFILNKSVPVADVLNAIRKLRIDEICNVSIFDVYESPSIGEANKAIALEVLLQSNKETLADEKIAEISKKIVDSISKSCNGVLRDQ